jgi:hypothetical protein
MQQTSVSIQLNWEVCGFPPFSNHRSRSRDAALAETEARVVRTQPAQKIIGAHS